MSREIHVLKWCDACTAEIADSDGAVEPATSEVVINGRTLDLCDRHTKGLWQPLSELLDEYGMRSDQLVAAPPQRRASPGTGTSGHSVSSSFTKGQHGPWHCLCNAKPFATGDELAAHLRTRHKIKPPTMTGVYGNRCPIDGTEIRILGPHIKRSHPELPNTTAAFPAALKLGDPYKVHAKQRRALGR